jgi:Glycosyl hydrolase family 47
LLAIIAVWLLGAWYMLGPTSSFYGTSSGTSNRADLSQLEPTDRRRWYQRPERYPVKSPTTLPTGKPAADIPRIQANVPREDSDAKNIRLERQAAVKASFEHSWSGYKQYAWLRDEVTPVSERARDPFGGWAATLVDALDTLWIMGMKDDFKKAVRACDKIDFSITGSQDINVFETTIRYLGGFLASYELSGKKHGSLLKKAVEVGELLMSAFDTPNRMPITRWDWAA